MAGSGSPTLLPRRTVRTSRCWASASDAAAAWSPYLVTIKGVRIAFLGVSQVAELASSWVATNTRPGEANSINLRRTLAAVRAATQGRRRGDRDHALGNRGPGVPGREPARARAQAGQRPARTSSWGRTRTRCRALAGSARRSWPTGWRTSCGGRRPTAPSTGVLLLTLHRHAPLTRAFRASDRLSDRPADRRYRPRRAAGPCALPQPAGLHEPVGSSRALTPAVRRGAPGHPWGSGSATPRVAGEFACRRGCPYSGDTDAGWSSSVARWAHNPEVAGSNPAPATRSEARSISSGPFACTVVDVSRSCRRTKFWSYF